MIVSPDTWPALWETIEDEFQASSEKGVTVIHSVQEVETVCAVKMLQVGMRTRGIQFSQYPVENHSGLQQTLEQLLTDSKEMRTVILLNCGASQYIGNFVPASCEGTRFVIVDSHRPIDQRYHNEEDRDAVLILADDDPLQLTDIPAASGLDDMTPQEREDLLAKAQEEEEQEEDELEGLDSPAKRQRLADGSSQERGGRVHRDMLRMLRERDKQLANYLDMGSSYGKPSPLVLLPLAEVLLAKSDNSLLWPAAVGLTDQWVYQRLSNQHYETWYRQLKDAVIAADANFAAQQQQQQQQRNGRGSDRRSDSGSGKQPISQAKLVAAKDYRLMLFRHWNLFNAFCYSPYVAPRLQTWRPGGQEAVSLLFANMGVPTDQAKTDYNSMQGRVQNRFSQQLERALAATSLSYKELAADGFQLHHNRKVTAASDVVHACTALLSDYSVSDVQDQGASSLGFWKALDALDCHTQHGWDQLLKGITDAKVLQQAIIMDGGNMVTDQKLKVNPSARLQELNLVALAPTNAAEFRHPLTLLRLAHFVRDSTKIARQGGGLRAYNYPIMVIGPEDGASWCIVIGLRSNILADNAQFNIFGRTFKDVLSSADSEVQWDTSRQGFDASVVYVHKDSLVTFCADVRAELIQNAAADAAAAAKQSQQQTQQQYGSQPDSAQAPDNARQRGSSSSKDQAAAGAGAGVGAGGDGTQGEGEGAGEGSQFSQHASLAASENVDQEEDASMQELDMVAGSDDEEVDGPQ